jgi:serine/threonine-protein kinase
LFILTNGFSCADLAEPEAIVANIGYTDRRLQCPSGGVMDTDANALFRELADRSRDEREEFYARHGVPAAVCAEVESLLRFDRRTDNSFRACVADAADEALRETPGASAAAQPAVSGQVLGSYTLTSPIGQGGMGSVWLARRSDGRFEGVAAVKLLNASFVGRAVEERFRREGNVLARLRHPHIAHLIDAGVSPSGQPYLVLEHVEGDHIDRWCDARTLGVEARIRVFLDVLTAVAHAHGNLIVHRDIKPSNILVSHDGRVKLLDFGIAKLIEQEDGGAATLLTHDGSWALTPAYAAPEQLTGGPITIATDIYSLGVVLYLLLCGRHPYASPAQSPADLVTAIVHTDPPRLSDAVIGGDQPAADVETRAVNRATTADRLRRLLRGDLDIIVAKALKKNPQERYSSVAAFAEDLRRYLAHQPIGAMPDTLAYRSAKFVRRNRVAVVFGTLAVLAMAGGLAGTMTQARRATQQAALAIEQQQRAEAVRDFLVDVFKETEPAIPGAPLPTVLDVVKNAVREARANPSMNALARTELLGHLGVVIGLQGDVATSQSVLEEAFRDAERRLGPDAELTVRIGAGFAEALIDAGAYDRARTLLDALLARTPVHLSAARATLLTWSSSLHSARLDDEETNLREAHEAVRLCRSACEPNALGNALIALATAQNLSGRAAESVATFEEVVALKRKQYGPSHWRVANSLKELSRPLRRLGQLDRAEAVLREALAISDAVLDPDDHRRTSYLNALSMLLWVKRDYGDALEAGRESVRITRAALGNDHPDLSLDLNNLGMFMAATGDYQGAIDVLRDALRRREREFGTENLRTAVTRSNYGDTLARAGDVKAGIAELRHAISSFRRSGTDSEEPFIATEKLARLYVDSGDSDAALAAYEDIRRAAEQRPERAHWTARAAIGRGRTLLLLGRLTEARSALDEASRAAEQSPLAAEPALELQLARALVDCRLDPGAESNARAVASLTSMTAMKFPPVRLRVFAEQVQKAAAPGSSQRSAVR